MKKINQLLIATIFFITLSFSCVGVMIPDAQASLWDDQVGMDSVGQTYGVNNPTDKNNQIQVILARVIKASLGLLGIIFLVLLVWAGYKYMTAAGNEDKVSEAIGQIRTAVIGLIIILISWSIASYITDCVLDITQGGMIWMCQ